MDLGHFPDGHFKVIMADPPWKMSLGTKSRPQHYERMTIAEIKAMDVRRITDPAGARCFLWITAPLLDRAPEILKAWGFRFCSVRTWVKLNPRENGLFFFRDSLARGTGYEVAGNAEFLIIGKSGKPQSIKGNPWSSVVIDPRREHSRKPDIIRDEIAARLDGPRLELFARSSAPGWEVAGNETGKFNGVAA